MGMAVARVALDGVSESSFYRQSEVARAFVKSLADHGSDYEREIASRSLALSEDACFSLQRDGDLRLLEMTAEGLPPSPTMTIAEIGVSMWTGSLGQANFDCRAEVGSRFLQYVAEKGTEREKTIAGIVLEPFSKLKPFRWNNVSLENQWRDASNAIHQALLSITANGGAPLAAALIDLGLKMSEPYRLPVLNTLSKNSGDRALSAVAGALSDAYSALPEERDRGELAIPAFQELQKSTGLTTDAALVRHALKARENTRYMTDKEGGRAVIGTAFLRAMADHATMPENSRAAREALDACTPHGIFDRIFHRKKNSEIAEIQSGAFKTILGNLKKIELEKDLQNEMEKSVAERVLGTTGGDSSVPAGAVEEDEQFIEVYGIKLSKKQWDYMR